MGEPRAWPSDSKAFNPTSDGVPVNMPQEPRLGKVFQFDPIVPRHPRALPVAPELTGGALPPAACPFDAAQPIAPPSPPNKPPFVATAAPAPEEPEKTKISAERLAFLERVEELMAVKSEVADLKAENKTLISIVSRLQRELDQLKGAHKA